MLTDDDLQAIRARAEAATPGPWVDDGWDCFHDGAEWERSVMVGEYIVANCPSERFGRVEDIPDDTPAIFNTTFIAHAREDIPKLLAEITRLKAALAEAERDSLAWQNELQYGEGR